MRDIAEQRLRAAVSAPSHAYIFAGEPGSGKKAAARAFAKALQCESETAEACGVCLSCRVFESGNHPDVFFVKPAKTKSIGVDDVRSQIVLPMSEKPFRYRYKIFIVAEPMTPQAQNALLKTIEEPAPFGIFLFLTESLELYLPTVLSRCAALKFGSETEVPQDELTVLAQKVARDIWEMDVLQIYALYAQVEKSRDSVQSFLDMLYLCCRERLNEYRDTKIFKGLEAITDAKRALQQNGNFQMTIEMMFLKMSGVLT